MDERPPSASRRTSRAPAAITPRQGRSSHPKTARAAPGEARQKLQDELKQMRKEKEELKERVRTVASRAKAEREESRRRISSMIAEWQEKAVMYKRKLRALATDLRNKEKHHGRSKLSKRDCDSYDNANKVIIANFLRFEVLPHIKFLDPKHYPRYAPDDEYSFYFKLADQLAFPPDVVIEMFWDDRVVPRVNKYLIDWRSNVNHAARKLCLGKCHWCVWGAARIHVSDHLHALST